MSRTKVVVYLEGINTSKYARRVVVEVPDGPYMDEIKEMKPEQLGDALEGTSSTDWEPVNALKIRTESIFVMDYEVEDDEEPDIRLFRNQDGELQIGE